MVKEQKAASSGNDAVGPERKVFAHVKTNHSCRTEDGWHLHVVRTRQPNVLGSRKYPIMLCPGLGSSGAYSFDLSPAVSLSDWLASRGWDVWTVELRGNGQSDKPVLFKRGRWWTIDDYVSKDVPALIHYVCSQTNSDGVHVMGHSMGGMIMTRVMATRPEAAAKIKSAIIIGSGCFLEESWWRSTEATIPLARMLYTVPAGGFLRLYSHMALTWCGIPALDQLYFEPKNTDPVLARTLLSRNFSAISPGVIIQFRSAFRRHGLLTSDGKAAYADPAALSRVKTPVMFMCGDHDRMCPPSGARRTFNMFSGEHKQFVLVGPNPQGCGTRHHYGHFDILMGNHVTEEVFPMLHDWYAKHDSAPTKQQQKQHQHQQQYEQQRHQQQPPDVQAHIMHVGAAGKLPEPTTRAGPLRSKL